MVPPFDAATHTRAAVVSAISLYGTPVQPTSTKRPQVISSVATVIPEIGFDEEPISPVMRLETVTKKNPNKPIRIPETRLIPSSCAAHIITATPNDPPPTTGIGRAPPALATRARAPPPPPLRPLPA